MSNLSRGTGRAGPDRSRLRGWRRAWRVSGGRIPGVARSRDQPDWVVGTSIGAINAALIAGSPFSERLDRANRILEASGNRAFHGPAAAELVCPGRPATCSRSRRGYRPSSGRGPKPSSARMPRWARTPPAYSQSRRCREILEDLVDFDRINRGPMRLSVGASKVRSSELVYFDSRGDAAGRRPYRLPGALPPAFPAVRIDGELYWDGGILSNTPVELVFDDAATPRAGPSLPSTWEPAQAGTGDDLAGDEPAQGSPILEPFRQPHRRQRANTSCAM